jgi:DNA-binding PadR family transcriptional regulator
VSRGALYKSLERLGDKGMLEWSVGDSTPERGGLPRRVFRVTPAGVQALRENRAVFLHFWSGLEETLG